MFSKTNEYKMNLLEKIVMNKLWEIDLCKQNVPVRQLEKSKYFGRATHSLKSTLMQKGGHSIIAEIKRASPVAGTINSNSAIKKIIEGYASAGVSGISILTDKFYFKGSIKDFATVRDSSSLPLLRKDFIVDEYQVIESKAHGADAILLIAAILDIRQFAKLNALAKSIGLEVLLEVHAAEELKYLDHGKVDIVGVNNRNLNTLEINLETSTRLSASIPTDQIKISESGIESVENALTLLSYGYNGLLIGTLFMKEKDPGRACQEFIQKLQLSKSVAL